MLLDCKLLLTSPSAVDFQFPSASDRWFGRTELTGTNLRWLGTETWSQLGN